MIKGISKNKAMGIPAEPIVSGHHERRFFDDQKAAILAELRTILESQPFRNSSRSKQFLSYVVQHKLEGREDLLKERTIGMDIFQRQAGYATGDDAVVRVQAGEVRRRLERYYQTLQMRRRFTSNCRSVLILQNFAGTESRRRRRQIFPLQPEIAGCHGSPARSV